MHKFESISPIVLRPVKYALRVPISIQSEIVFAIREITTTNVSVCDMARSRVCLMTATAATKMCPRQISSLKKAETMPYDTYYAREATPTMIKNSVSACPRKPHEQKIVLVHLGRSGNAP